MSKNETQKLIMNILGTKPIAFNADLAHALGSVNAGLLLSQLLFWDGKGDDPEWTYKTIKMIEGETGLSRREQETAIKICKKFNLVRVRLRGIPAKRYFHLDIENIIELLKKYYASLSEKDKQVWRKTPNKNVGNEQSNTESTPEITNKDFVIQTRQFKDLPDSFTKKELAEAYINGSRVFKPFYRGDEMRWVQRTRKWFVLDKYGEWLEFCGSKEEIEWKKNNYKNYQYGRNNK